eukprot:CAMPEP_0175419324 /NCGR_PEP_ID=MMETSP0095-20121207/46170_1 /TAXON_ID=311494 /ORGANISM="Alexandrium monilatum, Strain CCMP3105" /LENGTH=178 /DNA_ID=CAMNT_0016718511 /DNA_START=108 /DNA_END=640 /DNA_ORIENTATION=+
MKAHNIPRTPPGAALVKFSSTATDRPLEPRPHAAPEGPPTSIRHSLLPSGLHPLRLLAAASSNGPGPAGLPSRDLLLVLLPLLSQVLLHALVDLESVDARHKRRGYAGGHQLWVGQEEEVREGCSKVGAVQAFQPGRRGEVNLPAMRAEDLSRALTEKVRHADGQDRLVQPLALHKRA